MPPAKEPLLHISRDKRSVIKLRPLPPSPKGPTAPMPRPRPSPGTSTLREKSIARPSPVRLGELKTRKNPLHTETWVPPETWGSTHSQLKPTKKSSDLKDRANNRHMISRFCNRRKASNRPIELKETQSASKSSKIPESSPAIGETQESIRTVKELLPYQDQFRAAGLAVTSKEQKAYHRRGKLAPLLGKMSPGSEWLRLDGGIETKELVNEMQMVIEVKKDDSPSPINVEQISQKSGEDKLSDGSPLSTKRGPNEQQDPKTQPDRNPPSILDEEKENIIPSAPNPQSIPTDKTLPALPRVFSQVLVRHGSGPSRNSSWSAAMRQFPPTIMEQKEPGSPDKQHHVRKRNQKTATSSMKSTTSYGTAIIQPAKSYGQLQIRNTKQSSVSEVTVITTKTPHPSVMSSIELPVPKSVSVGTRIRTGTPTSLEKALDEAVRRLQFMGESVVTPSTVKSKASPRSKSKGTGEGKHKRSTSKTAPSPSQKLQMAKALRREKLLTPSTGGAGSSPRSKPSPGSTKKRVEEVGSSPANTAEMAREAGVMTASPTPIIEEAMAVIIPRAPSRPPPPRPGSESVMASIEVDGPPGPGPSATYIPKDVEGRAPLRITRPELSPDPAGFPLPLSRPESNRRGSRDMGQPQFRVSKRSSLITNQRSSTHRPPSHSHQRPPSQRPPTRRQSHRPPLSNLFHSPFPSPHRLPGTGNRSSSRTSTANPRNSSTRNSHQNSTRNAQRNSNHPDRHLPASDILKGLKIMCAASADEDLDAWFRHKTGLRLRRFLADLRTFEELGEDGMRSISDGKRGRRRERTMKSETRMEKGKGFERGSMGYGRDSGNESGRESGRWSGREGRRGSVKESVRERGYEMRPGRDLNYGRGSGYGREARGSEAGHARGSTYGSFETRHRGSSSRTHALGMNGIHEDGPGAERKRRSGNGRNSIAFEKRQNVGY